MSNYPPPPPRRGGSGDYPPQDPGGAYPPPDPNWNQPPYPPVGTGPLNQPSGFDDNPFKSDFRPKKKRKLGNAIDDLRDPMNERRIEYLAWGMVVLLMGCGIILFAINAEAAKNILLIIGPLLVGGILMGSGLIQRLIFAFNVSLPTWGVAILASAFGLTQLIALLTNREGIDNVGTQSIYFVGLIVVISGMVIIMQVFRPPKV